MVENIENPREYYIQCTLLRVLSLQFQLKIKKVQEISVNASIASCQVGQQVRVFSELASHIEKTSRKMNFNIHQILGYVNALTEICLRALIKYRHIEKYLIVQNTIHQQTNLQLVNEAIHTLKKEIETDYEKVKNNLYPLQTSTKNFDNLINRLFSSLTAIRIELSTFLNTQNISSVKSLSNSLESLLQEMTEEYEQLQYQVDKLKKLINYKSNRNRSL